MYVYIYVEFLHNIHARLVYMYVYISIYISSHFELQISYLFLGSLILFFRYISYVSASTAIHNVCVCVCVYIRI